MPLHKMIQLLFFHGFDGHNLPSLLLTAFVDLSVSTLADVGDDVVVAVTFGVVHDI